MMKMKMLVVSFAVAYVSLVTAIGQQVQPDKRAVHEDREKQEERAKRRREESTLRGVLLMPKTGTNAPVRK